MGTNCDLAWAAGVFDGEGSTFVHHTDKYRQYRYVTMSVGATTHNRQAPEILIRFQKAVGVGHITGPYVRKNGLESRFVWHWRAQGQEDVKVAMRLILPWLGRVKRRQAVIAFRSVKGGEAGGFQGEDVCESQGREEAAGLGRPV